MSERLHTAALSAGCLRYCPVSDGFEVTGQDVAVIGTGPCGVKQALFLRSFTDRLTLIAPDEAHVLDDAQRRSLADTGVAIAPGPLQTLALEALGLRLGYGGGSRVFQCAYPASGSTVHSDLAADLGAALTTEGCLKFDMHQRTSVQGD